MVKPVINRMLNLMPKLARLFIIKNRFEASAIIYALALGGAERGKHYLDIYPGFAGKMLFLAAMVAVFMAGAKIMDALTYERKSLNMAEVQRADLP